MEGNRPVENFGASGAGTAVGSQGLGWARKGSVPSPCLVRWGGVPLLLGNVQPAGSCEQPPAPPAPAFWAGGSSHKPVPPCPAVSPHMPRAGPLGTGTGFLQDAAVWSGGNSGGLECRGAGGEEGWEVGAREAPAASLGAVGGGGVLVAADRGKRSSLGPCSTHRALGYGGHWARGPGGTLCWVGWRREALPPRGRLHT